MLRRKVFLGSDFLNLIWTSLNSVTNAILTFVFTPLFLTAFGLEDYAYINIWITVNVILLVFDLGINLTINNIIASDENSIKDKQNYFLYYDVIITRRIAVIVVLFFLIVLINQLWVTPLDLKVLWVVILISISSALQFLIQYFYNAYLGLFLHKKVSQANILFLLLRFGVGYIFALILSDIVVFFVVQLIISVLQYAFYKKKIFERLVLKFGAKSTLDHEKIQDKKSYIRQITILSFASISLSHMDRLWVFLEDNLTSYSIYAIAFSGASIIQLVIQPLYKTYFSRYSKLKDAPFDDKMKSLVSSLIIASCLLSILSLSVFLYSEALLRLWLNTSYTADILFHFNLVLLGLTLAGYFWLPAAYMQANGYPELHNKVMILSIILGVILYILDRILVLELSPAVIWIGHGLLLVIIEGLYLLRKVLFKRTYYVLFYGLVLPSLIVLGMYYALSQLTDISEFIEFLVMILTVFLFSGYLLHKKNILKNAFQ